MMTAKNAGPATTAYMETLKRSAARMREMAQGVPVPVFRPLVSWPACAHARQSEIDSFMRAASLFNR